MNNHYSHHSHHYYRNDDECSVIDSYSEPRDSRAISMMPNNSHHPFAHRQHQQPYYPPSHVPGNDSYMVGVPCPADLHTKQSHQGLLSSSTEKSNATTVIDNYNYQPPKTTQHTSTNLSRDKSYKDRYRESRAGGDSGMSECCGCCCGGCIRCACLPACCCLSPIIIWLLTIIVLAGIAVALYFNWDKITHAINHDQGTLSSTIAPSPSMSFTPPPAPAPSV